MRDESSQSLAHSDTLVRVYIPGLPLFFIDLRWKECFYLDFMASVGSSCWKTYIYYNNVELIHQLVVVKF